MAATAIVAGVVAAGQIISGIQSANSIRSAAEISRNVADMNAYYAAMDGFYAEADGFTELARYQTQAEQVAAEQEVIYASKGVDSDFGTAAEMKSETKMTAFLNTIDLTNAARQRGLGLQRESRNISLNGQLQQLQSGLTASSVQAQGVIGGAATFASGYGK